MERRLIETSFTEEDEKIEGSLRPKKLEDYIGQDRIRESLRISIEAARQRGAARSCSVLWTAGAWKDDAVGYHRQRNGG